MANPVLAQPDTFAPAPASQAPLGASGWWQGPGAQSYQGGPATQTGFAYAPGQAPYPTYDPAVPGQPAAPAAADPARMTIDDVLTKTAVCLGAVVLVAVATWRLLGDNLTALMPAAVICGLAAFIIPMVSAFRQSVGPALAIIYSVLEGVFLGAISGIFELQFPGIVFQAVLATFVAAGCTLAAFHFGKIRMTAKMTRILFISLISYAVVALVNFVLSLAGVNLGLVAGPTGSVSGLAWLFAGVGVVLAVFSLIQDFQYIEQGVRQGAPAKASWTAAFGLTVTMVFLYLKILQILSYLRR